jgi:hypothetical protein
MIAANAETSGTAQAVAIAVAGRACPTQRRRFRCALGELRATRGEHQRHPGDQPEDEVSVPKMGGSEPSPLPIEMIAISNTAPAGEQAYDDTLTIGGLPCIGIWDAKAKNLWSLLDAWSIPSSSSHRPPPAGARALHWWGIAGHAVAIHIMVRRYAPLEAAASLVSRGS